ncbi:Uncharacterised protein [BD1-7 clade bacterium]|uniref:Alkyl hydroperoxide reductase subunit C/ Thiol specific antioxidant domain-containing protein n=1 Tax=BD1-7 clade bacterium TaxID=2029982 RepID=A0A5S9PH82_9GAMM|nr:Uncharacterised protein [BD1-7 clade bacterium]CAA0103335.1 Uncharacterised protein [BD1-7 clade bacterium]
MMTRFHQIFAIAILIFGICNPAHTDDAVNVSPSPLTTLATFDGQPIRIPNNTLTHLIFQSIWDSYEGLGEEARVADLPDAFKAASQQVWVQLGINVTDEQLAAYQRSFPQMNPLMLDRGFQLMRSLGGWDMPWHVILNDDVVLFSGTGASLSALANEYLSSPLALTNWVKTLNQPVLQTEVNDSKTPPVVFSNPAATPRIPASHYTKPKSGDKAPALTAKTMTGNTINLRQRSRQKPLSIVFIDALCPMPHFPNCEKKLEQLNQAVANSTDREWIGIVSSYYIDESIARQFKQEFRFKLPLIFDQGNRIYQTFGVHASPYQIDIDRSGFIQQRGDVIH